MEDKQQFIHIVESYINTPFHHQGRTPGAGLDCAGVPLCAVWELGFKHYPNYVGYDVRPNGRSLARILGKYLNPISTNDMQPGDIVLMTFTSWPQHVGVIVNDNYIVHASQAVNKVVKQRMDSKWQGLIVRTYRIPEFM